MKINSTSKKHEIYIYIHKRQSNPISKKGNLAHHVGEIREDLFEEGKLKGACRADSTHCGEKHLRQYEALGQQPEEVE